MAIGLPQSLITYLSDLKAGSLLTQLLGEATNNAVRHLHPSYQDFSSCYPYRTVRPYWAVSSNSFR